MKIRSITNSLSHIDPAKIDHFDDIQDCLEDAEKSLAGALGAPEKPGPAQQ